ncbi:MAG: xanthine dehydrogenase family protein molybdopterin-binding subunit [Betaproteobacteria bacterium]|nr:xanthine dehydrogenase family protein molybdopterin-binding subunit [Betaproteobacteria bacterium]
MGVKNVGAVVQRLEDPRLLTGRGRYTDDMLLPGMLEMAFVRASEAHALIRSIDVAAARAAPGVLAVWTLADLGAAAQKPMVQSYPHPAIRQNRTQYPLAKDEVCYVGEALAVVVAENRYLAEDAAQLVAVDYETLPAVIDARDAARTGAATAHRGASDNLAATLAWKFGDAAAALARAPHVFRESYFQHRGAPHSMEGRAVIAQHDAALDQLTLWSASQSPFLVRRFLAQYLNREESAIRVIAPDVGGGFGPKAGHYPEELVAALAAIKLGRPVKWIEDRREHFLSTTQQRDQWWEVEVACEADGRLLALRAHCVHDNGAYLPYGLLLPLTSLGPFPGAYAIPSVEVTLACLFTNAVPTTPIRGAGRPNAAFVLERSLDTVARNLGLDRAQVRRSNFVRKDQFPYATGARLPNGVAVQYDSGDYAACLEMALKASGYAAFEAKRAAAAKDGRTIGLGLASYNEDTGLPPYEGATVRVLPSGRICVELGSCAQGQGLETIAAQIAADQFDVDPQEVIVKTGDTALAALALSTVGSRVASTAGPSVHLAAMEVRAKAVRLAALQLEAAETDLEITRGAVHIAGVPDRKVMLADLAKRLVAGVNVPLPQGFAPGLEATAYHTPERAVYANGSNAAEVQVDLDTGAVTLLDYWVAHDCGNLINPMLVEGQIIGGVVHGIGNALFEHMKYDRESGQPLTTNLGEYLLPLATEMPRIHLEHMQTPSPLNALGVKGAGEGGTIPGIACIVSAIEDALKPLGVKVNEYPLSPERLLELIDAQREGKP